MDPAASAKFKDDVVSKIRSCLISTKGQVTLRKLEEDYDMLLGERIPYSKLGFKNLESFLATVPTLQVTKHNGNVYVDAKATAETAHICDMVLRQKSVTKKRPPVRTQRRWNVPNSKYHHHHHGNPGYRPNYYNKSQGGNRPAAYKPVQFISSPNRRPNQPQQHYHQQQQQQQQPQRQFSNASSSSISSSPSPPNKSQPQRPQAPVPAPTTNNGYNHVQQQQKQEPNNKIPSSKIFPGTPSAIPTSSSLSFPKPSQSSGSPSSAAPSNYGSSNSTPRTNSTRSPGTADSSTQSTPTPPIAIVNDAKAQRSPVVVPDKNIYESSPEANPLQSAKRRIIKFMEEHQSDRDSGTSSPTNSIPSPNLNGTTANIMENLVFGGDPLTDLKHFAAVVRLGEVEVTFNHTKTKGKGGKKCYYCKIKIGKNLYSNYPQEHHDEKSAERFSAQKALDDLVPTYTKRRSMLISGDEDVLVRVPPMLEKHTNAVWTTQVESNYVEKYNEQLPTNWLQVIDSSPYVSMQKCMGGYVLKYCKPGEKGKLLDINLNIFDVSVPCNTVSFNEANQLFAVITVAVSVNEIWCYQIGIPEYDSFLEMSNNMETFYGISKNKENMNPKTVNIGSCYAVQNGTSGWARVKALEELEDGSVHCFMVDIGEECTVSKAELYYLRKEFASEQAQVFVCRLDGVEELRDVSMKSQYLRDLIGKTVCLELVEEEAPDFNNISLLVNMYDVDTEELINDEIVTSLTAESATPSLDKTGITQVHVSNVESNGDMFVQVRNASYDRLMELMEVMRQYLSKEPCANFLQNITSDMGDTSKLYLFKTKDNTYERVQFLDWSPDGEYAQIYYVDVGKAEIINLKTEKMYPLDQLDKLLSKYPPQALKVRMMIEQMPSKLVEMVAKHMPPTQPVLLKIISYDNENVPWVEFFTRNNDMGLFCVNKSIAVEAELEKVDTTNNNERAKSPSRLLFNMLQLESGVRNVPSGGILKKPPLPEKGRYFNVNVPFAVNPWNFFVQPLETFDTLKAMMEDLQTTYMNAPPHFTSLDQIDQIVPGHIYASEHEDGRWYRTCVLKVIHSGSISVFYCDFGYYTNLALSQLIPLDKKFMDLPYQALKARIHGITPKKQKWTMEDCEVFKNLVTKKQFVSILVDIEKDQLHSSDIMLQLLLIDTTSDVDVYIKDVMVKNGLAISVE